MYPKQLLFTLMILPWLTDLSGQSPPLPHYVNYTVADGLPSSEVYHALEDSRGYMWFGTDNGIVRFDGYEFKTYGPAEGVTDPVVFSLAEGPDGRVWGCSITGLLFGWSEQIDEFEELGHKLVIGKENNPKLSFYKIIEITPRYEFVLATKYFGIYSLDTTGCIEVFMNLDYRTYYSVNSSVPLAVYSTNSIDSVSRNRYGPRNEFSFTVLADDYSISHTDTAIFSGDLLGKRIVFTHTEAFQNFIVLASNNLIQVREIGGKTTEFPNHEQLIIEYYLPDEKGGFYICALEGGGVNHYNSIQDFINNQFQSFLPDIDASYIFFDQNNGIWITSVDQGIFYYPNPKITNYDNRNNLPASKLVSTAITNKRLFLAYENRELYEVLSEDHTVTNIPAVNHDAHPLFYDKVSSRLFGSIFQVIHNEVFLNANSKFARPTTYEGGLRIYDFSFYKKDTLLVTLQSFPALYVIPTRKLVPITYPVKRGYIRTNASRFTPNGRLLVGTNYGLYESMNWDTLIKNNLGFPELDVRIHKIIHLADSTLLFGTRGLGIIHYNYDTITVIKKENGLASDMVRHLHLADDGAVWVSTFSGISKVKFDLDPKNRTVAGTPYTVRSFNVAHGLPSNEIHEIKSHGEDIWVAASNGLTKFIEPPIDSTPALPGIRNLLVNGERFKLDSLLFSTDSQAGFQFSPDQNNFEITYSTVDFKMQGKIPYRYRLHPQDEWTSTFLRTLNYTALPSGPCYFEVQSKNQDGYWSNSAHLNFTIAKPWYEWTSVRLLALLGFTGIIATFFTLRQQRIDQVRVTKDQMNKLEKSALQAQMNPHFIFNCLNSINQFILKNDAAAASLYLSKFAKLIRQTLNISVEGEHTLYDELRMLENYIALEKLRFKNQLEYTIKVDEQIDQMRISIPPLLIQPYIENAIIHGLNNRPDVGKITVHFGQNNTGIRVTISDNGRGFDPASKSRNGKSVGMRITQQRLELLGRTKISDNVIIKSADTGTEVTILIST